MKKIGLTLLVLFFLAMPVPAEIEGKIAVAAGGSTPADRVGTVAARSPYFLIFDGTGNLLEVIDNPYKGTQKGAGPLAARFLAQKGVTVAVAEEFGKNMIQAMKEKGIQYLEFQGSVEAAVNRIVTAR